MEDANAEHMDNVLQCEYVSRSWVPRSRFHLFASVYLEEKSRLDRFVRSLKVRPSNGSLVQELNIELTLTTLERPGMPWRYNKEQTSQLEEDGTMEQVTPTDWLHLVSLLLCRRLPNLKHLTISMGQISFRHTHESFYKSFCQFRNIAELSLSFVMVDDLSHFCRLIYAIPSVRHLLMDEVKWSPASSLVTETPSHPSIKKIQLRSLRYNSLRTIEFVEVVRWLTQTRTADTIERLEAEVPSDSSWTSSDIQIVGNFISRCGSNLTHVSFEGGIISQEDASSLGEIHLAL